MNRVLAENLYKALKEVKRTKTHTLPILNHAKLEFTNGELIITSTDLEKSLQSKCPSIMEEEWTTCVPMVHEVETQHDKNGNARYYYDKGHIFKYYPFLDFVKVCAEYKDVLEFTFNPQTQTVTIKIQGERSNTEFKCMDAQEFPAVEINNP
jgi:DNA polymerase III sliding clamp (beta) subunit (PCNA family)